MPSVLTDLLGWLVQPWFVAIWYAIGAIGAAWMIYDAQTANSALNPPLKACWPIIIFFFSALGIGLYLITSRPSDIGSYREGRPKMERFTEYSKPRWRKVVASAIHCVGGDGLGIMTAMVAARLWGFSFWQEFWFEYAVGYAFGWFIFQTWAMRLQGNGWLMSFWMGGRAEFFSMITVMVGMGLSMRLLTPVLVGQPPQPDTAAFWMLGAMGLMAGFVLTYPMNLWLVSIGWKHGQGHEHMLGKQQGEQTSRRDSSMQPAS
ncbi:DUF4396 domain-containing protein [Methylobacterium symbioticum]|uniref:DUF4396 domain-containing protein n=1 Tax=Methylobacterium symbioticum TaxID=2584084 RepID=A0A509EJL1_9HYPH|nr:DUF4396 domain-containing protein [Methylobacterium symbioticum]VUD74348.1 hypothetical protein MET9862_04977 [Methylobacterium symbioticum]